MIEGTGFEFKAEHAPAGLRLTARPTDPRLTPLCATVESAWLFGPAKFLKQVIARTGMSFEGEVSFAYGHEYPDELAEGVTVRCLDQEVTVSEALFHAFVSEFGGLYLAAKSRSGMSSPKDAELERLLKALGVS